VIPVPANVPIGGEWATLVPQVAGFAPGFPWPIQEVLFRAPPIGVGGLTPQHRAIEWLYAEIRPQHLGMGTATNAAVRTWVQTIVGRPNDDAGHVVGQNQGGPGDQVWNLFPQSSNFNRGAYAQFTEQMINQIVRNAGLAQVWWNFLFGNLLMPFRATSFRFLIAAPGPNGVAAVDELLNP
jgi:DNA/RNA non-specific endonuclease